MRLAPDLAPAWSNAVTLTHPSTLLALAAAILLSAPLAASEPVDDPVGFGAQQRIPATLTLNKSDDGRNARMKPVYDHYRPKVVFGGREVICAVRIPRALRSIAPGESGDVHLECKDPVTVARAGTRLVVREGKDVGHVDIHLPPAPVATP